MGVKRVKMAQVGEETQCYFCCTWVTEEVEHRYPCTHVVAVHGNCHLALRDFVILCAECDIRNLYTVFVYPTGLLELP